MQYREELAVTTEGRLGEDKNVLEQQVQELSQGKEDMESKIR